MSPATQNADDLSRNPGPREESDQARAREQQTQRDAGRERSQSRDANRSIEPRASTQETREMLVSLYGRGATNDAKAAYGASPGATDAGWQAFERMMTPVKQFIADGGMPYNDAALAQTTEYAGIQTPAEELTPPETRGSPSGWAEIPQQEGPQPTDVEELDPRSDQSRDETDRKTETVPAQELIERAKNAKSMDELDEIELLSKGRATVLDAVNAREAELSAKR